MDLKQLKRAQIVRIRNVTKGTILAEKAKIASSFWARTKGLLGRDSLPKGEGLVIVPCSAIHTFFMRFPIDVIFVNKKGIIVALKNSLKKGRYFSSNFRGYFVIELPENNLKDGPTNVGDEIRVEILAKNVQF